jgi:hypothetical protein
MNMHGATYFIFALAVCSQSAFKDVFFPETRIQLRLIHSSIGCHISSFFSSKSVPFLKKIDFQRDHARDSW